jgi:hypothetical protein
VTLDEEGLDRQRIAREFGVAVNMTANELAEWLDTETSKSVGWKGPDGTLRESVGHASGRRTVFILRKHPRERTADTSRRSRPIRSPPAGAIP